ncbi:MAG: TonB-dependent receptor, partial [Acidobacteriota bacterium]
SITATSATDKLNSYRKVGETTSVSYTSKFGIFRTGFWYEWANSDRYQIPTDPRTFIDVLTPNFHEKFITQSAQPFAQYSYRITRRLTVTAGFKVSNYNIHLNQFADNGSIIGCLGGTVKAGICSGGLNFVSHTANYRSWQPTVDAHYRIKSNWSAYAQWATGNVIPPSSVFDVKNAVVAVTPKPTVTKAFQFGSVYKTNRFTLDADAYFIRAQNAYSSAPDAAGNPVYFLTSDTLTKGFEIEGNLVVGKGFFLYGNGTIGSAKFDDPAHLWVASAPHDTETAGITYLRGNWDLGFFNKRIGQLYNDNSSIHQAVAIDPFNITNLFLNYTIKQASFLRGTKFRVGFNNLFDNHNIVGVAPAAKTTSVAAPGDFLTLMAGRSVSVAMTFGYAPKRQLLSIAA